MTLTPEQISRQKIDRNLKKSGWDVQDYKKINFGTSKGIAVREYPTEAGPADYILFVNKKPVGVIEAKRDDEAHRITKVEEQSAGYATSGLKHIGEADLPFVYESTGEITRFTDRRDPKPRSRAVFFFHQPGTLEEWIQNPQVRLCAGQPALRKEKQHHGYQ